MRFQPLGRAVLDWHIRTIRWRQLDCMIIKIFSDYCDSQYAKNFVEEYCKADTLDFYGKGRRVYITTDDDEYTHVVIINKAMPKLKTGIPKRNVLGLAWEPPGFLGVSQEFTEYAQSCIGKYLIGDLAPGMKEPFVEHYGYLWYSHPKKDIRDKKQIISTVISHKRWTPRQEYRHELARRILDANLPVDIYGNGCHLLERQGSDRIKGPFENWSDPYEDYLFTICVENFQSNHYFSEKVVSPLMSKCTPVYLGCPNIKDYVGDTLISLSGDIETDMDLIREILRDPSRYYRQIRPEKVDGRLNFLRNVEALFA